MQTLDTVLSALAPHLTGETQQQVLAQALVATYAIRDEDSRASVLSALALQLTGDLVTKALAAALRIRDKNSQAHAR